MRSWQFMFILSLLLMVSFFRFLEVDPWMNTKAEASSLPNTIQVTVEAGDTLWGIAARHRYNKSYSVQNVMNAIIEENQLQKSSIRPGEVLSIPILK